ncbi:flp pilus-assembly TadE/G-like family protein [Streptomyces sp. 5-8]|uniref:Flp pilus-assembly TadE/G-like family protein n=1 Tax=Streptomyces musisoli TaxID=2802280 RepID=A0ABS1P3U0_9ACTN|nr:flp pilus-assembly TadE/G-like family protein [Streptomyces musisoli]
MGAAWRRRGRREDFDRGSATVWSLGAIAVLCVVFGAVLALGHAVVVRHRAAGGADLAALAAADHWSEGGSAACARAERLAAAQGVRLVRCAIVGDTSEVAAVAGRGPFTAEVRARAGPPGPVPPRPDRPSPPAPASPLLASPLSVSPPSAYPLRDSPPSDSPPRAFPPLPLPLPASPLPALPPRAPLPSASPREPPAAAP